MYGRNIGEQSYLFPIVKIQREQKKIAVAEEKPWLRHFCNCTAHAKGIFANFTEFIQRHAKRF
jgi:hypothetical protein